MPLSSRQATRAADRRRWDRRGCRCRAAPVRCAARPETAGHGDRPCVGADARRRDTTLVKRLVQRQGRGRKAVRGEPAFALGRASRSIAAQAEPPFRSGGSSDVLAVWHGIPWRSWNYRAASPRMRRRRDRRPPRIGTSKARMPPGPAGRRCRGAATSSRPMTRANKPRRFRG